MYSRCSREPPGKDRRRLPLYTTGRGCDLFRIALGERGERPVTGANADKASETLPTIWRGEIALARVYEQRGGRSGGLRRNVPPHLYVRRFDGRGGTRLQVGGPREATGLPGPLRLDLSGKRLGMVWRYSRDPAELNSTYQARVGVVDGAGETVAIVGGGALSAPTLIGGAFDAGRYVFGSDCDDGSGGCEGRRRRVIRYDVAGRTLEVARLAPQFLLCVTAAAGRITVVRERPEPTVASACIGVRAQRSVCEVAELRPGELVFRPMRSSLLP